eukprot:Skav220860  [mRNA]  locus=scaffold193:57512:64811:+ [translate_table: standard]
MAEDVTHDVIIIGGPDAETRMEAKVGDVEADAGAAWVHGVKGNPLIEDGWIRPEDSECTSADQTWEQRLAAVGALAAGDQQGRSLQASSSCSEGCGTQILVQRLADEAQRLGLKAGPSESLGLQQREVFLGQEVCAVEELDGGSLATLAPQAEELTDEEALEAAQQLLSLAPEEIRASHFTRWGRVPWSCGSYSSLGDTTALKRGGAGGVDLRLKELGESM